MDTKPLFDFLENIPSAAQIGEVRESLENRIALLSDMLDQRFAEINTKVADLQRENAELNETLENCVKVIANNTALIGGIAKIINERRDETSAAINDCNDRINNLLASIESLKAAPSTENSESRIPRVPRTPSPSIEEDVVEETPQIVEETPQIVEETPQIVEEIPQIVEETPQIVEEKQPEEPQAPVQTIAESIHVEESLADKLSKSVDHNTVASALNSSHIESIKSAITIADRFRFQRELFSGNGALMGSVIDELDAMSTLAEAEAYIAKNFKWSVDNQAVQDFLSILARRY